MARVGALWIGGLEPYMDENFLSGAMVQLGQEGVVSIKVMSNKFTGEPAGYGFINFESDQRAILTMHRLGGKIIPNSNPPVRFKLNHNSTRLQQGEPDTSIWVGDLTPEVDDFALYQFFTQRYQSVRCAKVVLDDSGFSKGYGFVRFGSESDQHHALAQMTGEHGLGSKPIKVSLANQRNRGGTAGYSGGASTGSTLGGPPVQANGGGGGGGRPGGGGGGQQNGGSNWRGGFERSQDNGWPGGPAPSQPGWPSGAQGSAGGGGGGGAGGGTPGAAAIAQAEYNPYHYYQFAHQMSQISQAQQQQQYAAAWSAWQQHQQQQQQQQQQQNPQPQ